MLKKGKEKHPKVDQQIAKQPILLTRARPSTVDQRPLISALTPTTSILQENIQGKPFSIIIDRLVEEQQYSSLRDLSSQRLSGSENSLSETEQTSVQQQNTTPKTRSLPDLSDTLDNSEELDQTIIQHQQLPPTASTSQGESDNVNRGEELGQYAERLENPTLRELNETVNTTNLFDEFREIAIRQQQSTPKAPQQQELAIDNPDWNNLEETSAESSERTDDQEESEPMDNQQQQVMDGASAQQIPNNGANNIVRENQISTRMTDERMRIDPFSGDINPTVIDFLKIYEYNGGRKEMTDDQLVEKLVDYLRGEALLWYVETYKGKEKTVKFEEVRREIINRFGPSSSVNKARSELRNRYQQKDENIGMYVRDILKLCTKVDEKMSEENKIYQIMHNLLPSYQNMIVAHEVKTTDELLSRLKAIENNLEIMPLASGMSPKGSEQPMVYNSISREAELMKEMNEIKQSMQQMMSSQRNQQRNFTTPNRFALAGNVYPQRNQYNFSPSPNQMPINSRNAHQQQALPQHYQPPRGARMPDGQPICNYCGIPGHVMRHCRRYNRTNYPSGNMQYQAQAAALPQIEGRRETNKDQGKGWR